MKRVFKMEEEKAKELKFKACVDSEGDFLISASIDGEDWSDICFIDAEEGILVPCAFASEALGLNLDANGCIKVAQ